MFQINNCLDKLTCKAILCSHDINVLIDTGSDVTILSYQIFCDLPRRFCKLNPSNMRISSASGDNLKVIGAVRLPIKFGSQLIDHNFTVVDKLSHSCIVGLDLLKRHNVDLKLSSNTMIFNGERLPLVPYNSVITKGRLTENLHIPPETITFAYIQPHASIKNMNSVYEISSGKSKLIENEPGLSIMHSVAKLHKNGLLPVVILNSTHRNYHLNKGNVIAHILKHDQTSCQIDEITSGTTLPDQSDPKYDVSNFKIEDPELPDKYRRDLHALIKEYKSIFATHAYDIGRANCEVQIPLLNSKPISHKPFRVPLSLQPEVKRQIADMLRYDIIEKSHSPWSFPLVVVKKPSLPGSNQPQYRICTDFRRLNSVVKCFSFPMHNFEDTLSKLANSRYFSTVDLNQAFLHLPIRESDREILSFACEEGRFQFKKLPFGYVNSPSNFLEYMHDVLKDLDHTRSHMDDIIIFSETPSAHIRHLRALFQRLKESNLKVKLQKCNFFKLKLKYLGYIISAQGLQIDNEKIEAIKAIPTPTSIKGVRSFLGATGFLRRFVPGYAQITKPLVELTRKNATFAWSPSRQVAFQSLKDSLMSDSVLAFPDISKEFYLFTDASANCLGSALMQKDSNGHLRPIYYISHHFSAAERKWSTIEREMYSVIYSLKKLLL